MKKRILIVTAVILVIVGVVLGMKFLFKEQYNEKGISHFLVITINKKQEKEYIADLENHKVYMEGLDLEETYFKNIDAKNISVKDAIERNLISIEDWKENAKKIIKEEGKEILQFDYYEIEITDEECIIRPIKK